MRPNPWRTKTSRSRELGVAAIEFALLMPFIAVIVLALVDYGYYFYIGVNATEAARTAAVQAGATAAPMNAGAGVTDCLDPLIATVKGASAAPAKAGVDYMKNNVNAAIGADTTVTVSCVSMGAGNPVAFGVVVQVLFPPPSGAVHFGLPRTGSNLRYTTPILYHE